MKKMRCVKDLVGIGGAVFLAGEVYEIVSESPDYYTIQGKKRVHVLTKGGRDIKHFKFTHDTPEPKHRLLKPITGRALVADRPVSGCADYQREVGRFIAAYGFDACATGFFDNNVDRYVAQLRPANFAWLIDHGYLERIEERTYFVGQKIVVRNGLGADFHVVSHRPSRRPYVALRHGNGNWRAPIQVKDMNNITQAEMDRMVDPADFGGVVGDDDELPF